MCLCVIPYIFRLTLFFKSIILQTMSTNANISKSSRLSGSVQGSFSVRAVREGFGMGFTDYQKDIARRFTDLDSAMRPGFNFSGVYANTGPVSNSIEINFPTTYLDIGPPSQNIRLVPEILAVRVSADTEDFGLYWTGEDPFRALKTQFRRFRDSLFIQGVEVEAPMKEHITFSDGYNNNQYIFIMNENPVPVQKLWRFVVFARGPYGMSKTFSIIEQELAS